MRRYLFVILTLAATLSAACSGTSTPINFPIPANTPSLSPTNVPTLPPDVTSQVYRTDVFCPTENEQAKQYYNDAISFQEQGKLDKAKQLFLKAIDLDPTYCDAMDNLGQLLRSQGDLEGAIKWYKKSIEILSNNVVAHQNLAFVYSIQGDIDNAIAEYQLLIEINPDNPEGYYGLGSIYLDLGKPQQAMTQLEKAEELYERNSSPLVIDARFLLGVSYFFLEDYEKAKGYFEPIYSQREDDLLINYFLGLCYLAPQFENLELARKYLSKAQELGMDIPEDVLQKIGK